MKALLMILIYSGLLSLTMSNTRPGQKKNSSRVISTTSADSIAFKAELMPLLQKKCSPCHFAGGKMYAKMPFDRSATIAIHSAGMLKRLNDDNDKKVLEKYIREHLSSK